MKYCILCLTLVCAVQVSTVLAHSNGDLRLVDGGSSSIGRVEMFYQGEWGTICDDRTSFQAVHVVCRSLGFSNSRPVRFNVLRIGAGRGRILLDEVRCAGNESNVLQCSHSAFGQNNCQRAQEMAIDCYGRDIGARVELRNGTATDGVLALSHHDIFGTACLPDWNHPGNSIVACRMLGVETPGVTPLPVSRAFYGETTDLPTLLSNMECDGDETNLTQCYHGRLIRAPMTKPCPDMMDVALDCLGSANMEVSLVNGNDTAGELRLVYRGISGSVCPIAVRRQHAAKVFCRMLGYGDYEGVLLDARNSTTKTILSYMECRGNEKNIAQCGRILPLAQNWCDGIDGVLAIACRPQPDIAVRLVDGNATFGRLGVQRNGQWGNVCDLKVGRAEAAVVCRMLNLPTENVVVTESPQVSNRPLVLDFLSCAGDEDNLNQCYIDRRGNLFCHIVDLWISCA